MHLTTFVSLLAVGAAAAPAARQTDLSTKMAMPSLAAASAPALPLRRQAAPASEAAAPSGQPSFREFTEEQDSKKAAAEAQKDPLDAYLETFDDPSGNYDEKAQDEALDHYLDSLNKEKKEKPAGPANGTVAPEAKPASEEPSMPAMAKMETEESKPANTTSEKPAVPEMKVEESKPTNATAAPKNETAKAPAKDDSVDSMFSGLLKSLLGEESKPSAPAVPQNMTAAPQNMTSEPTKEPTKAPVEEKAVEGQKNITSPAANATSAQPSGTAAAGFHDINKHLEKLNKLDMLPVGGLPVKREAFEEGDRFDSRFSSSSAAPEFPQPTGMTSEQGWQEAPAAQPSQSFAAPAQQQEETPQFGGQVFAQPSGMPAKSAPMAETPSNGTESFRGSERMDSARLSRTHKAAFKTDAPSSSKGKSGGSPLGNLVPLKRQQTPPAAAPSKPTAGPQSGSPAQQGPPAASSAPSDPFDALFDLADMEGPPSGGKPQQGSAPSEQKNATAAPQGGASSETGSKPAGSSAPSSPFAGLFGGESEKKPQGEQQQGPPSESKPEQSEEESSSPLAGLMGGRKQAPAQNETAAPTEQKPEEKPEEKESSSPLAGLMGGKKEAPAQNETATPTEGKPEQKHEEENSSPLAGLMGSQKKPEESSASKPAGGPPSASSSAPAESSSAPASPLAGLMGGKRAITEQHEEFSPEMAEPTPGASEPAPGVGESSPSSKAAPAPSTESSPIDDIFADFA